MSAARPFEDGRPDEPPALRTALALLRRGLWPIPIHPPTARVKSPGKRPIGPAWGKARHTPETLRAAWAACPAANVGLLLGKEGGVIDVEVDDRRRGPATLAGLMGGEDVPTAGWDSEGGEHRLFRYDDRLARYKGVLNVGGRQEWLAGVELRIGANGSGGEQFQSVCPPSVSTSGFVRRWHAHAEIAALPDSFFAYLAERMPRPGPKAPPRPRILKFTGRRPVGEWDAEAVREAVRPHHRELAAEWGVTFTGKVWDGDWAECHAVDREDRDPSAGLNLESGVYHDFGTEAPGLSFFALAVAMGAFPDLTTAINSLGERFGVPRADVYVPPPTIGKGSKKGFFPGEGDMEGDGRDAGPEAPADPPPAADPLDEDATAADLIRLNTTIRWLWEGWIPVGVLTILAADAGVGKTRLCADLLRRINLGLPWPDGTPPTLPVGSRALWVPADNQHAEIGSFPGVFGFPPECLYLNATRRNPFAGTMLDAVADLKDFEARILRIRPALVFIDTSLNATDRSAHKPEDAKAFFKPLQEIAARTQTAIVCVTHLNAGGRPLGRRIIGQGRVVIQMEQPDPDQEHRRKLHVTKSNSLFPPPLGVTMGGAGNEYDDTPPVAPAGVEGAGPPPTKLLACIEWLRDQLDLPGRVSDIRNAAEKAGFSAKVLYSARERLPIMEYEVENRKWWQLTDDPPPF
jgi:hypothetical protein